MSKKVYVLSAWSGASCGVYSSKKKLAEAVDYWSKHLSKYEADLVLTWEEWNVNYIPEASSWDWAYISSDHNSMELNGNGRIVPYRKWFGKNLVSRKWTGAQT